MCVSPNGLQCWSLGAPWACHTPVIGQPWTPATVEVNNFCFRVPTLRSLDLSKKLIVEKTKTSPG